MHYKNGREARNGDPVIGPAWTGSKEIVAGTIHSIAPGCETCNCTVAIPIVGGVNQSSCRTVSDFYHAEDAFAAIEPKIDTQVQAMPVPVAAQSAS